MPPTTTLDTLSLWASDDPVMWQAALSSYQSQLMSLKNKKLTDLDNWVWNELETSVRKRKPACMNKEEWVKLVTWKITRGKTRPLLGYAKEQVDQTVRDATATALENLSEENEKKNDDVGAWLSTCLKPLTDLRGVGAATAAAFLAACTDQIPMMSDELIAVTLQPTASEYTEKRLIEMVKIVRAKAKKVNLTAREVEHAVLAEAWKTTYQGKQRKDTAGAATTKPATKRKR